MRENLAAGRASGKFGHCEIESLAVRGMGHRLPASCLAKLRETPRPLSPSRVCRPCRSPRPHYRRSPHVIGDRERGVKEAKRRKLMRRRSGLESFLPGLRDVTRGLDRSEERGLAAAEGRARDELSGRGAPATSQGTKPANGDPSTAHHLAHQSRRCPNFPLARPAAISDPIQQSRQSAAGATLIAGATLGRPHARLYNPINPRALKSKATICTTCAWARSAARRLRLRSCCGTSRGSARRAP